MAILSNIFKVFVVLALVSYIHAAPHIPPVLANDPATLRTPRHGAPLTPEERGTIKNNFRVSNKASLEERDDGDQRAINLGGFLFPLCLSIF